MSLTLESCILGCQVVLSIFRFAVHVNICTIMFAHNHVSAQSMYIYIYIGGSASHTCLLIQASLLGRLLEHRFGRLKPWQRAAPATADSECESIYDHVAAITFAVPAHNPPLSVKPPESVVPRRGGSGFPKPAPGGPAAVFNRLEFRGRA